MNPTILLDLILRRLRKSLELDAESDRKDGEVKTSEDVEDVTANENVDSGLEVEAGGGNNGEEAAAEVAEDLANKNVE